MACSHVSTLFAKGNDTPLHVSLLNSICERRNRFVYLKFFFFKNRISQKANNKQYIFTVNRTQLNNSIDFPYITDCKKPTLTITALSLHPINLFLPPNFVLNRYLTRWKNRKKTKRENPVVDIDADYTFFLERVRFVLCLQSPTKGLIKGTHQVSTFGINKSRVLKWFVIGVQDRVFKWNQRSIEVSNMWDKKK